MTGTVTTTKDNLPVSGVNVIVKGMHNGTNTDAKGAYKLAVPAEGGTLVFSAVGLETHEEVVGSRSTVDVALNPDVAQLNEVVVVGYGTLEKKNLTSSITSLKAKDLVPGVNGATIANALKGKVSSLVVQETASPNSATALQLRGMASVNTSREPLVVIDGMPGGDLRSVALEDIQSIDVLKDAAAGAIYGTRATGGVIVITTKKAQEGKMKISYIGEVIFKQDFGKPRVMNAEEYLKYKPGATNYGYDIDWWEEGMSKNPTSQRHVVNIQGGTATAKLYATAAYEDNRGVLSGDDRIDYSGRINGDFKLIDGWLEIGTHVAYRQANRDLSSPGVGTLLAVNPTRSPYDLTQWNPRNGLDDPNTIRDAELITNNQLDKWFRPDVALTLNIKPIKGLAYHHNVGFENRQSEFHYYAPSTTTVTEYQNVSGQGTAELRFQKENRLNTDGYFSYNNTLGDHSVNAAAGYSYYEFNGEMFGMKNYGFAVDGIKMWDIGSGINLNNPAVANKAEMQSSKQITQKLLAYFGRINYSFKDRYLLSGTFRREGSSKFAANKRWGNFWQVSGAWRLSQESFMQNIAAINDLKIRASYGVTGNEGFSADYAATMYGADSYYPLPNGNWAYSYGITQNINPDLGWEEKHEWNLGIDFVLFNSRLFGKLDLYTRNVVGLIYNVDVPQPPYVQAQMYKNIGTLKNNGWEFEIGGNVVSAGNWDYTMKANVSHNVTKIGSLWGNQTYYTGAYVGRAGDLHRIEENARVGSFWLYQYAGVDNEGRFIALDKDGNKIVPEVDGKNLEDKRYIGNYIPKAIIGWTHDLQYKNFSLGLTFTSWIKYDIYNAIEHEMGMQAGLPGGLRNQLLDAYTKNGAIQGQVLESDYFLQDGTFLKLQNFTLGYKLNTKKLLKIMESARFYLTGNNVFRITKYKGLNPEVDITGWEGGVEWASVYPQTRTFTLGMQLTF
ncbi:hypothetical protein A8C56_09710 [Niabella ginsenosidivorans]|uniref:SusC/RagA family TonB-linked outer membrane protein n=1 Tax=Niabella ginsenosidivorans TaxID=1176587 RepID=A0A1A9I901_9BACT|nr:hypothetical protein A8C56_09710 [Niabella ginsenosidivorans]